MGRLAPLLLLVLAPALGVACGGRGAPPPVSPPERMSPLDGLDPRLNTDPPGAELSLVPDICCDGDRVYVVWYDRRARNLDVYFNRSRDGGRTWLPVDVRLDSGPPGAATSLVPRICCSGERVYVVWYDDRNGASDVYFNRSLDGGDTWLGADVRVNRGQAGAFESREPMICCAGARVYVAWLDRRAGDWDVYFSRSLDGGDTWLESDVRLDRAEEGPEGGPDDEPDGEPAEGPDVDQARICCADLSVYVAWNDTRDGGSSVYATRSWDAGNTWLASDVRIDDDLGPGSAGAPVMACAGERVHVGWTDQRDGSLDAYVASSSDGALTWADAQRVDTDESGVAASTGVRLCAYGATVRAVWADDRNGRSDVYFNRSLDGGLSWGGQDRRLGATLPGRSNALSPRICCTGEDLHVVWRDDVNGRFDVFGSYSADGGLSWSDPDLRFDTDEAGSAHSLEPAVCCAGPRVRVAWYDLRHGLGDIYANGADYGAFP